MLNGYLLDRFDRDHVVGTHAGDSRVPTYPGPVDSTLATRQPAVTASAVSAAPATICATKVA